MYFYNHQVNIDDLQFLIENIQNAEQTLIIIK